MAPGILEVVFPTLFEGLFVTGRLQSFGVGIFPAAAPTMVRVFENRDLRKRTPCASGRVERRA